MADYPVFEGSLEIRQTGGARVLRGRFPYGSLGTIASRGRVRKERFEPRAFRFAIEQEPERRIDVLVGHDYGKPIASRQSGTLDIRDGDDAVTFEARLPDDPPSWVVDAEKAVTAGLMVGLSPGFQVPPANVVADAERLIGRTRQPRRPDTQHRSRRAQGDVRGHGGRLHGRRCGPAGRRPCTAPTEASAVAVTITPVQLRQALEAHPAMAERLHPVAVALVERYAPDAPEDIQNEATIRVAGWLYETPSSGVRSEAVGDISTTWTPSMTSALRASGAMALLSPWKVRRGGVVGKAVVVSQPEVIIERPSRTPDATVSPSNGGSPMPDLPSVRLYLLTLDVPDVTAVTLPQMSGQEVIDAGSEVLAVTKRATSVAAPVECYQQLFHLNSTEREFLAIAIQDGQDPPSHFRVNPTAVPNAWDWPQPPTASNLGFVWTPNTGEAVIGGASYDVYRWPQLQTTFPSQCVFEWPVS